MNVHFSLGIDLGTSNSAIAVADLETDQTKIVEVTQILGPNQLGEMPMMASVLYVPHCEEFPNGSFPLPWDAAGEPAIVGQFAREHGALVPDRLVTSAKSWLSNPHIDPKQRILPWRSDIAEEKLSPLECSRRYLQHLRDAFLHAERVQGRDWDFSEAQIVLTVPASFDEVARSLTAEAAKAAGLGDVTLLEEPQAAFYAWTAKAGRTWRELVAPGDIVLVCDVGGGTADFSLIAVTDVDGVLELERVSVANTFCLAATTWIWRSPMRCRPSWRRRANRWIPGSSWLSCMPRPKPRSPCLRMASCERHRSRSPRAVLNCLPGRSRRLSIARC